MTSTYQLTFLPLCYNDINVLINSVNEEINKIAVWFRANKLAVNISKTKYIIFKTRNKKLNANLPDVVFNANERGCPFNPELVTPLERIHNNHINPNSRAYKLLGIFLDENLSLDAHINNLCKKLVKSLYCIKKAKNVINKSGLRSLYFALIHSHLSYCPIILNCSSKSNLKKLEKIQKKAIRIITNSRYNANASELFITEKILPFDKIIKQAKLLFMHSIVNNYAPISFENTFARNIDRPNDYNLRNANDFMLPNPRLEQFKKIPVYSLPLEWNMAGNLIYYANRTTFRIALKNQLFTEI